MEITINVKLTASPELAELLQAFTKPLIGSEKSGSEAVSEKTAVEKTVSKTKVAKTESTDGETVTVEQVRKAVSEKAQSGKKAAIKKLLAKYDSESVTALEEDKYADFLNDLNEL